jgi:hypothetical protein
MVAAMLFGLTSIGCSSVSDGSGASLPDTFPDGGPECSSLSDKATCPVGSFCLEEAFSGSVCKHVPAGCKDSPSCECVTGQGAYDCPRGLWTCEADEAGTVLQVGCVAN